MRIAFSILTFLMILTGVSAQTDTSRQNSDTVPDRVFFINQVERDGEVLPEIEIKEVTIIGYQASSGVFAAWRFQRLIYNLKIVYPYALVVRSDLSDVNAILEKMPDDMSRRKYLRDYERRILSEYEDEVRNMTITQGRLLIKLIDRETQNTSYELIRQYRGNFTAAFWQAIARIFGSNLKDRYDRYGEDLLIELIITEIEEGRL